MEGYCVKCRTIREFSVAENKTYETSRGTKYGVIGRCVVCNTKMSKMVKKSE